MNTSVATERQKRRELIATGLWYPARWAGMCIGCGGIYTEGVAIRQSYNGPWWVAECCSDGAA